MIDTPFTRSFGLKHAISLAPEPGLASGRLAAAVADAGGLGLIGCGGENAEWIAEELVKTGETAVGCGLSCRALKKDQARLEAALAGRPRAIYLNDGDPRPHAKTLHAAGVRMICEARGLDDAKCAAEAEAQVIVARGTDAAGQPARHTLFDLVPELADFIRREADDVILLAYGGIHDARTLAAALTLGADGAMMSRRLSASVEGGEGNAPPAATILDQITRRAEKILIHNRRAVIE